MAMINPASSKQQAASSEELNSCLLPPAHHSRGFTLLIAIIFMSVMLSFGLALGSLAYKQEVLASNAVESQYAFYAADAGLECALYADQQQNAFAYKRPDPGMPPFSCDGTTPVSSSEQWSPTGWIINLRLSLDSSAPQPRCADVTVYKPAPGSGTTYLYSQGYDVSCATLVNLSVANNPSTRFVARGLQSHY